MQLRSSRFLELLKKFISTSTFTNLRPLSCRKLLILSSTSYLVSENERWIKNDQYVLLPSPESSFAKKKGRHDISNEWPQYPSWHPRTSIDIFVSVTIYYGIFISGNSNRMKTLAITLAVLPLFLLAAGIDILSPFTQVTLLRTAGNSTPNFRHWRATAWLFMVLYIYTYCLVALHWS